MYNRRHTFMLLVVLFALPVSGYLLAAQPRGRASAPDRQAEIVRVDRAGPRAAPMPARLVAAAAPQANGRIVFASNRDGNHEIYAMNADGSEQTRLTYHPAYDDQPR